MPVATPLINGAPQGVIYTAPSSTGDAAYAGGSPAAVPSTGVQMPMTGEHNTAAHVGFLVLLALGVIVLLNYSGFRFVVDAGIGKGGR